jgi:predicted Fe-S protein YdhL (DUF1289 family)
MKEQPVITTQLPERKPASKCINECKADPTRQYCVGCLRTMEEIIQKGKDARSNRR